MDDTRHLDRLVLELNATGINRSSHSPRLEEWLVTLRGHGASDLYLVAGLPPSIRVNGVVRQLSEPVLDGDQIEEQVLGALPAHAAENYRSKGHADASLRR